MVLASMTTGGGLNTSGGGKLARNMDGATRKIPMGKSTQGSSKGAKSVDGVSASGILEANIMGSGKRVIGMAGAPLNVFLGGNT